MTIFAEQRLAPSNIWIACHACRRGKFLYADYPTIPGKGSASIRFKCQACGTLASGSYLDPRDNDADAWTVVNMNRREPTPMAPLTKVDSELKQKQV